MVHAIWVMIMKSCHPSIHPSIELYLNFSFGIFLVFNEVVSIISGRQVSFGLNILGWRRLHSVLVAFVVGVDVE